MQIRPVKFNIREDIDIHIICDYILHLYILTQGHCITESLDFFFFLVFAKLLRLASNLKSFCLSLKIAGITHKGHHNKLENSLDQFVKILFEQIKRKMI